MRPTVGTPTSQDTSKQWTMAAHGCLSQSICVATSYATLGADALADAMQETGATAIICNQKVRTSAAPSLAPLLSCAHRREGRVRSLRASASGQSTLPLFTVPVVVEKDHKLDLAQGPPP
eukprot:1092966-Prorocentrum_minimum.AAC.2